MPRDFGPNGWHFSADIADHGSATIAWWMKPRSLSGSRALVGHDGVWLLDGGNPIHMYNWAVGDVLNGGSIPLNVASSIILETYGGKVYVNNVLQVSGGTGNPNTAILQMGGRSSGAMDGIGCEYAIWNVILTAAEREQFHKGVNPKLIRPQNHFGWWPMWGIASPEPDLSNQKKYASGYGTPPYVGGHLMGSPMAL